tara:strand:+ start:3406 stop:3675 length:270 start_codon:yes stop_codon:yes gene_type:complete
MAILRKTTQALSVSYGAAIAVESGWENVSVTLDDAEIGFVVEIDAGNEEAVGAGSSWVLTTPGASTQGALSIKVKSDSGTPTASVIWFK